MSALGLLAVALGGFLGASARFLADRAVTDRTTGELPLGTLAVNVSGSVLLGLLAGLGLKGHLPSGVSDLVGTGFCGAFTTFSTWTVETVRLVEAGEYVIAAVTAVGGLVVGLLAAAAGLAVGLAV